MHKVFKYLSLILLFVATVTVSFAQYRDTLFIDPLPSSPRLAQLANPESDVAPNPYYRTTLPRIINVLRYARPVPYKKQIKLLDNDIQAPWQINTSANMRIEPIAIKQFILGRRLDDYTLEKVALDNPTLFPDSPTELANARIGNKLVEAEDYYLPSEELNVIPTANSILPEFTLERKYWKFGLESHVQFSQNYVSKNWHKGGGSNLNLYNRQYISATYSKNRIAWANELEWRLSAYTSEADTISKFRIADDLLRLHSNFGVVAFENLFYTLDGEVKTSLFTRREENKREVLSALFSPVNVNIGLGMKYLYEWNSKNYYGRKLKLSVILSPFAYDFRYSYKTQGIDLTRHGFATGKNFYHAFGSTLRIESVFDITPTISWQSRLYYNTSYHRVEVEWDNSLDMAISRFFSTRLNVLTRFDDAVPRTDKNPTLLQVNELFSFGFRYVL